MASECNPRFHCFFVAILLKAPMSCVETLLMEVDPTMALFLAGSTKRNLVDRATFIKLVAVGFWQCRSKLLSKLFCRYSDAFSSPYNRVSLYCGQAVTAVFGAIASSTLGFSIDNVSKCLLGEMVWFSLFLSLPLGRDLLWSFLINSEGGVYR